MVCFYTIKVLIQLLVGLTLVTFGAAVTETFENNKNYLVNVSMWSFYAL